MKKLIVVALLILLSACKQVQTKTTAFYVPEYKSSGTIAVVAAQAEVNDSLEFANYKNQFEQKLAANGYTVVSNPSEAQYIALVAYGIDEGKSSVVSAPIFGQTGGGTTYSSGGVYGSGGSATYSGTSYTMPTYGVVGSAVGSVRLYTRAIALDIVDAQSIKSGKPIKVYEARAKSIGSCGIMAGVFTEILDGMFESFPGKSGEVRSVNVSQKGGC